MALPKISAKYQTTLAKKVAINDTTFTLTSLLDVNGATIPNGKYGFTVDEDNSSVEYFEATVTSTAGSSVVSINPTTLAETAGFTKEHRAGAVLKITDYSIIARLRAILDGEQDLDSTKPVKYDGQPAQSDPDELATVQYVLDNANGGTVAINRFVWAATAGETISSGEWVYFNESDGRWYLTDADDPTKCINVRIGKALGAGTAGNGISGGVFVGGLETSGTYVAGTKYYLSDTAGAIGTSAGTNEVLVGIGDENTDLNFVNVYDPEAVTPDEKAALTGTRGVPSSTNKYVTDDNVTEGDEVDQSQATQDTTSAVGQADSTGNRHELAQSFKPAKTKIRGVNLYKAADTGTFTGTVTVALQADSSGDPSGSNLASKTYTNSEWKALVAGEIEVIFSSEYASQVAGDTYWIVITTSTGDNSNHINVGVNSAGGYSDGGVKFNNATDGWTSVATIDLYFKTLEGNANQVVKTGDDGVVGFNLLSSNFNKFAGAGQATYSSGYYNFQIPMVGTAASAVPGAWTADSADVLLMGSCVEMEGTGPEKVYAKYSGGQGMMIDPVANVSTMRFSTTATSYEMSFYAVIQLDTLDILMGFVGDSNVSLTYNQTGDSAIMFTVNNGDLYGQTCERGVGGTTTQIEGVDTTVMNHYHIIADTQTSTAHFYVNGELKLSQSTNFPDNNDEIIPCFGRSTTSHCVFSNPWFAVKLR